LQKGLHRKFPALQGIDLDYSWWVWVDVSHDMMPLIIQPDPDETIYYAMEFGGNGGVLATPVVQRFGKNPTVEPIADAEWRPYSKIQLAYQ